MWNQKYRTMKTEFNLFLLTVAANIIAGVILIIIQHTFEKNDDNEKE